jgi:hypothetical protein
VDRTPRNCVTESIAQQRSAADRHSQRLLLCVIDAFLLFIATQVLAFLRHLSEDGGRAQCEKGKQEGRYCDTASWTTQRGKKR